jgi:hypothetical protein
MEAVALSWMLPYLAVLAVGDLVAEDLAAVHTVVCSREVHPAAAHIAMEAHPEEVRTGS